MDTGFIICGVSCLIFLSLALVFTLFKGKSTMLISGFNTMPKEKKKLYDKDRMAKDQRNSFLIWSAILGIGAVLSYYVSPDIAVCAFVVFLIMAFRDIHLDKEKAYINKKIVFLCNEILIFRIYIIGGHVREKGR